MISINFRDPRPIYEQVRDGLRQLVISGVLPPGSKMPSVRELASGLAINPNTIQRAYRELEQEGYICSVPGKGSFVCETADAVSGRRAELLEKFTALADELRTLGLTDDELFKALSENRIERSDKKWTP